MMASTLKYIENKRAKLYWFILGHNLKGKVVLTAFRIKASWINMPLFPEQEALDKEQCLEKKRYLLKLQK